MQDLSIGSAKCKFPPIFQDTMSALDIQHVNMVKSIVKCKTWAVQIEKVGVQKGGTLLSS